MFKQILFDFAEYQFRKQSDDSVFNLETRFQGIEDDATGANNAAAISQLQIDLAAEQVARQSQDTTNANLISAETTARTDADGVLQQNIDAEAAIARAAGPELVTAIQRKGSDIMRCFKSNSARQLTLPVTTSPPTTTHLH